MQRRFSAQKVVRGGRSRTDLEYLDVDLDLEIITCAIRLVIACTTNCTINLFALELSGD